MRGVDTVWYVKLKLSLTQGAACIDNAVVEDDVEQEMLLRPTSENKF